MPFRSESQRRFLYARKPHIAKEFSEKTPKGADLPEKVGKMTGPLHMIGRADEKFSLPMIAVNFTEGEPTEYPERGGYENMKPGKGGPIRLPQAGSREDMVAKRKDGGGPQIYAEQTMPDYEAVYGTGVQASERQVEQEVANRRRAAAAQKTLAYGFHGQPPEPQVLWDPKKELMGVEQIVPDRPPRKTNSRPNPQGPVHTLPGKKEKYIPPPHKIEKSHLITLQKARTHKYYKRVVKPGGGYRYYYTKEQYEGRAKVPEQIVFDFEKPEPPKKEPSIVRTYGLRPYKEGEIYENSNGDVLKVVKTKGRRWVDEEDAMSFGFGMMDRSGYVYFAEARPVTKEEYEASPFFEIHQQRENERKVKVAFNDLKKEIQTIGEKPKGMHSLPDPIYEQNKRLRIYGGGSWITKEGNSIWFVENNGADGDNWSYNNVRTGGAGAIGIKAPITDQMKPKIDFLVSMKDKMS